LAYCFHCTCVSLSLAKAFTGPLFTPEPNGSAFPGSELKWNKKESSPNGRLNELKQPGFQKL